MLRLRRVGGGVRPLGVVRPRSALWLCSCVRLVGAAGDSGGALDVALGTVLGPLRGLSASGARENWLLFVGRCTIEKLLAGCKTLVIKRVWVFPKPWAGAPPTSPSTVTKMFYKKGPKPPGGCPGKKNTPTTAPREGKPTLQVPHNEKH